MSNSELKVDEFLTDTRIGCVATECKNYDHHNFSCRFKKVFIMRNGKCEQYSIEEKKINERKRQ